MSDTKTLSALQDLEDLIFRTIRNDLAFVHEDDAINEIKHRGAMRGDD